MKRVVVIVLVLAVVAAAAYFGGPSLVVRKEAEPTPVVLDMVASPLEAITAHGRLVPARWAELTSGASGKVEEITVAVGDVVEEGQVLARLEVEDLSLDVRIAELDVVVQKARLAQVMATPTPPAPESVASLKAQLASAQAVLDRLRSGPDPRAVEAARLAVDSAKNNLWAAQASRDVVMGVLKGGKGADLDAARARVAVAEVAVKLAELEYQWAQEGPTEEEMLAAEAQLAGVQEALAALERPVPPEELESLQAAVDQAQLRLEQLRQAEREQEARAQIVAPFAGTITGVDVYVGDYVTAYAPVFTLADLTELQIETTDVDEWRLRRVRVSEIVDAYVTALEGRVLSAQVVAIAPEATVLPTGDVGYVVTLSIDRQDPDLRWGMTVRIEFRIKR
jgi:HlyD family secretion protein